MNDQSFQKEFQILKDLGQETFKLRGSNIIVELMPEEEELKTKGGLYISAPSNHSKGDSVNAHKLQVGRVLMTGEGYWDDEKGSYETLEVKPGSIVVLPQFSTQVLSMFPGIMRPTSNRLVLVKFDQILAFYPTQEAFEAAKKALN